MFEKDELNDGGGSVPVVAARSFSFRAGE